MSLGGGGEIPKGGRAGRARSLGFLAPEGGGEIPRDLAPGGQIPRDLAPGGRNPRDTGFQKNDPSNSLPISNQLPCYFWKDNMSNNV